MRKLSQACVTLLMLDALWVCVGLMARADMWACIVAYWGILTVKNWADWRANR